MIELDLHDSFDTALTKFLMIDDDELEAIIEQLDIWLCAAEHAAHLNDIQTTH